MSRYMRQFDTCESKSLFWIHRWIRPPTESPPHNSKGPAGVCQGGISPPDCYNYVAVSIYAAFSNVSASRLYPIALALDAISSKTLAIDSLVMLLSFRCYTYVIAFDSNGRNNKIKL